MASSRGALVTVGQVGVLCRMGLMDKHVWPMACIIGD